jgi:hypothetical protein
VTDTELTRDQLDSFLKELYQSSGDVDTVCDYLKINSQLIFNHKVADSAFSDAWDRVLAHIEAEKSADPMRPLSECLENELIARLQLLMPEKYGWIDIDPDSI